MSKNTAKLSLRNKCTTDFSKVGGLNEHIRLLRELIILPLVYADLYSHFSIKAPRGILFYGPPGTGKTLVASALASELSKGQGKVHFFYRKGADVMDKWIGEAERKLRDLFDKAAKHQPSIIFFDELDGLAPVRSQRNDHVHCSVVTTLLALMDGLSNTPGVVVIGATNRVDAIDPALRRPGRFDRELYFPIPCTCARKDILQVLVESWTYKPNSEFLSSLAEITSGYTGSDLQALCSEAFLSCVKRLYPNISNGNARCKILIDKCHLKVQECDFLTARKNITPWTQRMPTKMKKLSQCIQPLLQRQLNWVLQQLQMVWPHFTTPEYRFEVDSERYLGRLLLIGSNRQGMYMHLVPALLQALEHLPIEFIDANTAIEKVLPMQHNTPRVLLLSRVHDWWDLVDDACRNALTALLEDVHPSTPLLLICTCDGNMSEILHNYFVNNSSIVIHIGNPTKEERIDFFRPLFFGSNVLSMQRVLYDEHVGTVVKNIKKENVSRKNAVRRRKRKKPITDGNIRLLWSKKQTNHQSEDNKHRQHSNILLQGKQNSIHINEDDTPKINLKSSFSLHCLHDTQKSIKFKHQENNNVLAKRNLSTIFEEPDLLNFCITPKNTAREDFLKSFHGRLKVHSRHSAPDLCVSTNQGPIRNEALNKSNPITTALTNLVSVNLKEEANVSNNDKTAIKQEVFTSSIENEFDKSIFGDILAAETTAINNLFERVTQVITKDYNVSQLELLYDTISACISINKNDFNNLLQKLDTTLASFENNFSS